jgi:hypothetical protein
MRTGLFLRAGFLLLADLPASCSRRHRAEMESPLIVKVF